MCGVLVILEEFRGRVCIIQEFLVLRYNRADLWKSGKHINGARRSKSAPSIYCTLLLVNHTAVLSPLQVDFPATPHSSVCL